MQGPHQHGFLGTHRFSKFGSGTHQFLRHKPYEVVLMGYNTKYYKKPKPLSHISLKPLNDTNFQNYLVLELTETAKYYNQNHQVIQNS